jgi:hypothetical protein
MNGKLKIKEAVLNYLVSDKIRRSYEEIEALEGSVTALLLSRY